jgi:tetratricopeptide (TPR) repeat protein
VADDLAKVSALDPFSIWSLFVGGPVEMARYSEGAPILTDDRMTLEFSAPRELHHRGGGENGVALGALLGAGGGPPAIRLARATAGASEWADRAAMMAKADIHAQAYDDYVRALTLDPSHASALDGLARAAVLTRAGSDALAWVKALTSSRPQTADTLVATSKLLAAVGASADAVEAATQASRILPVAPMALEQLASLFADAGDTPRLDATIETMRRVAPDRAATHYYAALVAFLGGRADEAVRLANHAIAIDAEYAPVYDLIGAAYTRLDQPAAAREAFERALTFDGHDSAAYTNLGLLELAAGNRAAAKNYFAEALWLEPESKVAREGLTRAKR